MPDRRHRAHLSLTPSLSPAGNGGPALLLRERQSSPPPQEPSVPRSSDGSGSGSTEKGSSGPAPSPGSSGSPDSGTAPDSSGSTGSAGSPSPSDDNPFAPPPEGRPDQPWRPRHPEGSGGGSDDADRQARGGVWSSDQPGRQGGGFGDRPGDPQKRKDPSTGGPGGLKWDPKDPAQRRARYALLAGMWSFFIAVLISKELGLLLSALAIYWGVGSLRAEPAPARADTAAVTGGSATPPAPALGARQQKSAAASGLVMAGLTLLFLAGWYTAQVVYSDYYTCVDDALTTTAQEQCERHLPERLRPLLAPGE